MDAPLAPTSARGSSAERSRRFAGASGTAHIEGAAVLDPIAGTGTAHFTIEGTITY